MDPMLMYVCVRCQVASPAIDRFDRAVRCRRTQLAIPSDRPSTSYQASLCLIFYMERSAHAGGTFRSSLRARLAGRSKENFVWIADSGIGSVNELVGISRLMQDACRLSAGVHLLLLRPVGFPRAWSKGTGPLKHL